ncbi:hypothetical protein UO65_3941 [Actinokineospora spheciospongiae]|uniref:Uncharacterized protein n=1 Tax=Actinokineospora spheciospongiae TaxID=909613 RepID=W7IJ20_9PSEU|nr:hypothetical protein UO65_3941 [Actinokineospora spheciospongiae]
MGHRRGPTHRKRVVSPVRVKTASRSGCGLVGDMVINGG